MNKKFSTLVASLLLASSMTAFAAGPVIDGSNTTVVSGTALKYEAGKAYFLQVGSAGNYLVAKLDHTTGKATLEIAAVDETLAGMQEALWVATVNTSGELPTFVFTNRATGTVLAINKAGVFSDGKEQTKADFPNMPEYVDQTIEMGGDIYQWYAVGGSAKPDKDNNVLYSPYAIKGANTYVTVLSYDNTSKSVYGKVVNATDLSATMDGAVNFKLAVYDTSKDYFLSVNEINTQLGQIGDQTKNGVVATANDFFKLNIPHAVSEGQFDKFQGELQARAFDRWEVKYGTEEGTEKEEIVEGDEVGEFVSIYPRSASKGKKAERLASYNMNAFNKTDKEFILYSKEMKEYIVVDTAYIKGTEQVNGGLMSFTTDKLYNAKNETRYRLPESYIFKFKYEPNTGKITIVSKGYMNPVSFKVADKQWVGAKATNLVTEENLKQYYGGTTGTPGAKPYANVPVKEGSFWATVKYNNANISASNPNGVEQTISIEELGDYTKPLSDATNSADGVLLAKVAFTYSNLVGTTVHTLGTTPDLVSLNLDGMYKLRNLAAGVYTFKVVGVKHPWNEYRIGKYLVKTLDGKPEYVEQANRQDYQEMPAAQWVVKSVGTSTSYAPVSVLNREFDGQFDSAIGGLVYSGGADDQIFFFGGDTLKYEKVAGANNARLGYKYLTDDELTDGVYTFNYLHELAMDKPINSKIDSAVWVDKDGEAIKFQLEKVVDDNYGYNGNLNGVAQLQRLVYRVRVKEDSKFDNIGRYLAYDSNRRKYYLASSKDNASFFFLKENNKTESDAYYTLLEANVAVNVMLTHFAYDATSLTALETKGDKIDYIVLDKDVLISTDADGNDWQYACATYGNHGDVDANGVAIKTWKVKAYPEDEAPYGVYRINSYVSTIESTLPDNTGNIFIVNLENKEGPISQAYEANEKYASSKVSVDNNTLDLVNGVLANNNVQEVVNSAFAVKTDETRIYRRLGDAEGEKLNGDNVVKFFRVNATAKEYLYEDANSVYSKDKDMNFLGVEGKGDSKNAAMLAMYTSGDRMPQYLIALDTTMFAGKEEICPVCGLKDCEHSKVEVAYTQGRFLVNLTDSVNYNMSVNKNYNKFRWNDMYTRLAFVDARLMGDSLIIMNSAYTGNKTQIDPRKATTIASKDTINIAPNHHSPALFQFRLLNDGSNDFLIESESWKDGVAFAGNIAPMNEGGWIKIQNGVPVIVKTTWAEAYKQAEVFNLELTSENPTDIEGADAATVSVIGGEGNVIVKGATGKHVIVTTVLGKELANTVATSDSAQISVSATGVVFVTVDGETTKVAVK